MRLAGMSFTSVKAYMPIEVADMEKIKNIIAVLLFCGVWTAASIIFWLNV